MAANEQHKLIDTNRKQTLSMLSGKNSNVLADLSTIDSSVDRKMFKSNVFDNEAIVVDGEFALGGNNKKTKTDDSQSMFYNRLLALSTQPEISDILDLLIDEMYSFEYGTNQFISLSEAFIEKLSIKDADKTAILTSAKESFDKVYSLHKFNQQSITKDYDIFKIMKLFFVLGKCRFFIEYDNLQAPTTVRAIHYLDPRLYSIDKFERQMQGRNMIFYKITRTGSVNSGTISGSWNSAYTIVSALPAIAVDAQIVDIDWADLDITNSISYLAGIERAFNVYRLMERSRIAWAVNNSQFRMIATIPTKGQGYSKSLQTLRAAMNKYSEKIEFNDNDGTVTVNGSPQTSFNKELWLAETTSGKPEFETVGSDGPDLTDMGPIMYFWQRFIRTTKIPPQMLDRDQQNFWSDDETAISLEYQRFQKYLDRIRRVCSPMVTKPVWADFAIKPENKVYASDLEVKNAIQIKWNTNDVFRKQLELAVLTKTAETIQTLGDLKMYEDDKIPILSKKILLKKYTELTDEDFAAHRAQIISDIEANQELAKKYKLDDDIDAGY